MGLSWVCHEFRFVMIVSHDQPAGPADQRPCSSWLDRGWDICWRTRDSLSWQFVRFILLIGFSWIYLGVILFEPCSFSDQMLCTSVSWYFAKTGICLHFFKDKYLPITSKELVCIIYCSKNVLAHRCDIWLNLVLIFALFKQLVLRYHRM